MLAACLSLGAPMRWRKSRWLPIRWRRSCKPIRASRRVSSRCNSQASCNSARASTFNPAAAGAGDTGFDSSSSRKTSKAKAKAKSTAKPQAVDPASARATAPGLPAPRAASPYQQPPKTAADDRFCPGAGRPAGRTRTDPPAEEAQGAHRASRTLMRRSACRPAPSRCFPRSNSSAATTPIRQHTAGGQRRQALHRRARNAGAVELVAARIQGRPARQLYRLQSGRDTDAEPALFQWQGGRARRRDTRHPHRSRQPLAGLHRQSRQPEFAGRHRQASGLRHLWWQRRPRPAYSAASIFRSRAMPSVPSIRTRN